MTPAVTSASSSATWIDPSHAATPLKIADPSANAANMPRGARPLAIIASSARSQSTAMRIA